MGLRYRRSVKIAPGVKVNFNKKSASVTVGGKGFHVTKNSNGRTTTSVNLPIKGLSYTDTKSSTSKQKNSTGHGRNVSSAPTSHVSTAKPTPKPKEKKAIAQSVLLDPPTAGIAIVGVLIIVVGFFVSGMSVPAGIIIALFGAYFIYIYILHKKHPDSGKYISAEQLARWRQLLSVSSGEAYELKKKSLPILLELKAATEKYCLQLPESAEDLLNAQQKLVDFSEFVIIKGDNPQQDLDRFSSMVAETRK